MSPVLQSPLALGADIVMHSTTKFLNGHSDGLGGALIGTKPEHKERFWLVQKAAGGILSPFECFLVLRGIRTLPLRMKQHEENGRAVAEFLSTQPKLKRLSYPGLKSHPQHELALKQQRGFGSMLSFDLGSRDAAGRFLAAIKLFLNAESLGGVESLASHSATTTHASLSDEERAVDGNHRRAGPVVGRDRRQGRSDRGPGAGAGGGVESRLMKGASVADDDDALRELVNAIVAGDAATVSRLLAASPELATASFGTGASRQEAKTYFLDPVARYINAGDTALHFAAAHTNQTSCASSSLRAQTCARKIVSATSHCTPPRWATRARMSGTLPHRWPRSSA